MPRSENVKIRHQFVKSFPTHSSVILEVCNRKQSVELVLLINLGFLCKSMVALFTRLEQSK